MSAVQAKPHKPSLAGHVAIMRIDHWFKNVFVIPGIVVAIGLVPGEISQQWWISCLIGLFATCLVASSNYTINEVLDAPSDLAHPVKHARPTPSGKVHIQLAYVQWIALMMIGVGMGWSQSPALGGTLLFLWIMGCAYNIRPVRTKELPYLDVLSEAVNNPIRMAAGWYMVGAHSLPPLSLLLSYWMVGCYFMAMKRYAELRDIGDPERAAAYRKSFAFYTPERLLVSIMFYGTAAMLFLGAFTMRYRLELILAFPFVSLVMAIYLMLAFKPNSAVQRPEGLYKEPALMGAVLACVIVASILLVTKVPVLHTIFAPTPVTVAVQK
jgi:4-hydroxybenzoate polyprenyltransferase